MAAHIDKARVKHLLETTIEGYRWIASESGCSHQRVAQIAREVRLDLSKRDRLSRIRAQRGRRTHGRFPDVICPKCKSDYIFRNGKSKRYGTQRYTCGDCNTHFMLEYQWVTSGDRDRHLAKIATSSGYTRSDGFERWQRTRRRVWPYLEGNYGDADTLLKVVNDAIPRTVPEHMRADICQDALVAILECKVEQSALTLKPFLSRWFKQNIIGYRPISLDMPSRRREGESVGQEMGIY